MEVYYLIDFENVHNEGLENIDSLTKNEHLYIFSTENALNIRMDILFSRGIDMKGHIVPAGKQSLDMHLAAYLGYLLGIHGKECAYVIISKDTDYDNIIKFWKGEGYSHISRKQKIPGVSSNQKKAAASAAAMTDQTINNKISVGMAYDFSGNDRSELNVFMQHGLIGMGYLSSDANRICKYVVAHCNDARMLKGIHNDLKNEFNNYLEIYEDVKTILGKFVRSKSKTKRGSQVRSKSITKRGSQVRSFFGQHFRKKIYIDKKEEIIGILLSSKTKQQVNNNLMKLYADGNVVSHIYQTIQPLIKDLPGK